MAHEGMAAEATRKVLEDVADLQSVIASRDGGWRAPAWAAIEDAGLCHAAVPEQLGGAELGLRSAFEVLQVAGSMALALPLAETTLAAWMLGIAGIAPPPGAMAFGPTTFSDSAVLDDGRLTARLRRLTFAADCRHAAVLARDDRGWLIVLLALEDGVTAAGENLAFEPLSSLQVRGAQVIASAKAPPGFTADATLMLGAVARAMQSAGALTRILSLTTDYITQRRAFGQMISRFQAVQHAVARLAGEVAAATAAATSAAEALDGVIADGRGFDDPALRLEVIAAKVRTATAARQGAAIAHQLHGAIGITDEHVLHRLTLRVLAWRDDFGTEMAWSERLGLQVCAAGADALWPLLASR